MLRFKLVVLYVLFVALAITGAWVVLDNAKQDDQENELVPDLRATNESVKLLQSQRLAEARDFNEKLANSNLAGFMRLLANHAEELKQLNRQVKEDMGPLPTNFSDSEVQKRERIVRAKHKGSISKFMDEVRKLPVKNNNENYLNDIEGIYVSCVIESSSRFWDICYFKFMYYELTANTLPLEVKKFGMGSLPEAFWLVGPDLHSSRLFIQHLSGHLASDNEEEVDESEYMYWEQHIVPNFSEAAPFLAALRQGSGETGIRNMLSASTYVFIGETLFLVNARPVLLPGGSIAGVLMSGYRLDQGQAKRDAARVVGVRPSLKRCLASASSHEDSDDAPTTALCEYEMAMQNKALSFFFKPPSTPQYQSLGSSLDKARSDRLIALCRTNSDACPTPEGATVRVGDMVGSSGNMNLDYMAPGSAIKIVTSATLPVSFRAHDTGFLMVVAIGVFSLIIGIFLILFISWRLSRPFNEIDKAVHEVIGGNFEYPIPFHYTEPLARSLGQSLSVMRAVLLGLPLPEEQEMQNTWAPTFSLPGVDAAGPEELAVAEGVELEIAEPGEAVASATEHYRSLFKQYVDARRRVGQDTSSITYIKFVEKIARMEKALRDKLGVKQIRLKVEERNGQVVLVPQKVAISEDTDPGRDMGGSDNAS